MLKPVDHTEQVLEGDTNHISPTYWASSFCRQDTDIWAAGVVLYNLLFVQRPYSVGISFDKTRETLERVEKFAGMSMMTKPGDGDAHFPFRLPDSTPHGKAAVRFLSGTRNTDFLLAFFAADRETNSGATVARAEAVAERARQYFKLAQEDADAGGASQQHTPQCAHSVQSLPSPPGGRSLSAELFKDTVHQCLTEPFRLTP